jgi:hypothetical protein
MEEYVPTPISKPSVNARPSKSADIAKPKPEVLATVHRQT